MPARLARSAIGAFFLVSVFAPSVFAQTTYDDWLALRTTKQARHHRLTMLNTRPDSFTIVVIRFVPDVSGNLVAIGEARNDSPYDLSYSRINFRFYDSGGNDLGGDWTYLFGGVNARILPNNRYETVLLPGQVGFFKLWTTIPASMMASYTAAPAGEDLPYAPPMVTEPFVARPPQKWSPLVYIPAALKFDTPYTVSGYVINDDQLDPNCPCGHENILAYNLRVSVAVYENGLISDVQSTLAVGPTAGDQCGMDPPTTGIVLHQGAGFHLSLVAPANSVGNQSLEWEEMGIFPRGLSVPPEGGSRSFTVAHKCGWTAEPRVPWIAVTDGASSAQPAGTVTVAVPQNDSGAWRTGLIDVAGMVVGVSQMQKCVYSASPSVLFVGPGLSNGWSAIATSNCYGTPSSSAGWLTVGGSISISPSNLLRLSVVQPNLTGVTRSAVVAISGTPVLTVSQSPASRAADFNQDGALDLLWHHEVDGRVALWFMRGSTLVQGTLLNPDRVSDLGWSPVGVVDVNHTGTPAIIWQDSDGSIAFWIMQGASLLYGFVLSGTPVVGPDWKIRGVADINQDGYTDLIWQNDSDGRISAWLMNSATMRGSADLGQVVDTNWKIVGTGDFNKDGWPDLVWQHQGDGRIAVWKMHGTDLIEGDLLSPGQVEDLDWQVRAVGDINGDDWPDLIWQHRTSGEVAAWLMNGTVAMSGIHIAQVDDPNWRIVAPR